MTDDARRKATDNAFDTPEGYAGQAYSREREAAQGRIDADDPKAEPNPPPPEDPDAFGTDQAASMGATTIAPPEEDEAAKLGDFA